MLSLQEKSKEKDNEKGKESTSNRNFLKHICTGRRTFCFSIVAIPVAILLFYGLEDKNAWFFGHDYINDYRYRIENNVVYNIGVMVSHYALIVTLSIIGILISWLAYETWKVSKISIRNSHFRSIIHHVEKYEQKSSKLSVVTIFAGVIALSVFFTVSTFDHIHAAKYPWTAPKWSK